jgi:UDP-glucose 4-epimerase
MKIFITGCGGFVGSHLAEAELKNGNTVIGLDIASDDKVRHLYDFRNFKYEIGEILDEQVMDPLVKKSDLIYHFGAIANVQTYCADPLRVLEVNIQSTRLVLQLAFKYDKKVVFSSSSEIYGKNLKVPWAEDDDRILGSTEKHRWCYTGSKAIGEHYCFAYAEKGLEVAICRFFNFYGPRLDFIGKGRVITCFLEKFLNGDPVMVVEPGDQTRCFTYISDGIDGILKLAHKKEAVGNAFNIGNDHEVSMLELAKLMKKIGNFQSEIIMVPATKIYGEGYEDIFRRVPDISKARKILGFKPKISLEVGLKKTIEWFKCSNDSKR